MHAIQKCRGDLLGGCENVIKKEIEAYSKGNGLSGALLRTNVILSARYHCLAKALGNKYDKTKTPYKNYENNKTYVDTYIGKLFDIILKKGKGK